MNVCVYYYDEFCEFELVHTVNAFKNCMFTAALENRVYISEEHQRYLPDKMLKDVNPDDVDLFIITGGDPSVNYDEPELKAFLDKLNEKNKLIAGICGGAETLAYYGLLDNKEATGDAYGFIVTEENKHIYEKVKIVNKDVVRDGNIITAVGQAFIEFSVELQKAMNMFENDEELQACYNWLKNNRYRSL